MILRMNNFDRFQPYGSGECAGRLRSRACDSMSTDVMRDKRFWATGNMHYGASVLGSRDHIYLNGRNNAGLGVSMAVQLSMIERFLP